ncbi:energy-coupling factor transporter ATPase [bacterium]|nr:energy-coupling factor transporter ATPase [bacterium]RQV98558.1 MAG: energy-coupling factor transporter ATPase [bacterium]
MVIQIENLFFTYQSPFFQSHQALSDISLTIQPEEVVAIVGATGSGKTTLIQHLNGLLQPTKGKIWINSVELAGSKINLGELRRKVGLVFQFPEIQLFEETVFDDVAFGPRNLKLPENQIEERVRNSLQLVGLDYDAFCRCSPFHLSGGERRRVAIAGILAMDPEILIMDEPTVSLDLCAAGKVKEIIMQYHRLGKTVIFVSHDMDLVAGLARRIVVLDNGRIIFDGPKEDLFQKRSLLERANLALPQVYQFMLKMRANGHPVRTDIFTLEEAKKELRNVLKSV